MLPCFLVVEVLCKTCGKKFKAKASHVKNGCGKYCSRECKYEGTRKGAIKACHKCGAKTYKTLKQLRCSKSGKFFCSRSCQTKWRNVVYIGKKHANWKHGKFVYRSVLRRAKRKEECQLCKTSDARILAVHHIDRDRLNNTPENLAWLCHNCHFLVHHYNAGADQELLK